MSGIMRKPTELGKNGFGWATGQKTTNAEAVSNGGQQRESLACPQYVYIPVAWGTAAAQGQSLMPITSTHGTMLAPV